MRLGAPPGALGLVNHLLAAEDWARGRLKPFAGQTARCEWGLLKCSLTITADGFLVAGDDGVAVAVVITLPAGAPLRALFGRQSLLAAAQISGSAELAETLAFMARNLRWDIEDDLAGLIGDIAARRLVEGGKRVARLQAEQARNFAINIAEYFTEEDPLIARREDLAGFCAAVGDVRERLLQLEQRVAALAG